MSNNIENERSVSTSKMYPIDLAPQKITIVKSVSNSELKMAHLVPGQQKTSVGSQIISHTGPLSLMRPSTQIISSSVASQPQMIVSGSPMLQVTQIVSQGSQIIAQGSQIISQSQLIGPSGQIVSPATQIISQGTQLSAPGGGNTGTQGNVVSNVSQVLNVGGQLVSGAGNLVVSSSVRTLPPSVRVLPPLPHHNARPALSNVSLSSTMSNVGGGMIVSKGVSSHVPRGPAAGASLAVPRVAARPVTPVSQQTLPIASLGGTWSSGARGVRGGVVYSSRTRGPAPRAPLPPAAAPPAPHPAHSTISSIVTLPATCVITSTTGSVITGSVRGLAPRAAAAPSPRPLPLLQRNYQPPKLSVGVVGVGNPVRNPVGNSAPAQLYYEVPRPAATGKHQPMSRANPVNVVNASIRTSIEDRPGGAATGASPQSRPSILRKRDLDGSPTKLSSVGPPFSPQHDDAMQWESEPVALTEQNVSLMNAKNLAMEQNSVFTGPCESGGGSTTVSAASSPAGDDAPSPPPRPALPPAHPAPPPATASNTQSIAVMEHEPLLRKKPRKQALNNEVRQCEYQAAEPPHEPESLRPHKRPQLSSSYVCGWRATALHFVRPSDVRRREPRPRDMLAIASERHVLASADGWKVRHLTAQMDDLVSLESDVSGQLSAVLRTLEGAHGKPHAALAPYAHSLLELVKGNIQRSKIVCEGIQEAREDILRVFTHRTFVSDILTRQADKRCFRKHRSQS